MCHRRLARFYHCCSEPNNPSFENFQDIGVADISQISDECQPGCIEVRRPQENIPAREKFRVEIVKLNEETGTQALRKGGLDRIVQSCRYGYQPLPDRYWHPASTGLIGGLPND